MAIKKVFIFLLIAELVVCDAAYNKCPASEEIPGCFCWGGLRDVIGLKCGAFHTKNLSLEDYSKVLQKTVFWQNLNLHFEKIQKESRLPSNVFEGLHVNVLNIKDSNIIRWADVEGGPAFVGLEATLERLVIVNSFPKIKSTSHERLPSPAQLTLGHIRYLDEINYHDCDINTLGNDWFENGPVSLKALWLHENRIQEIGDRAFSNLPNLKEIRVFGNEVERLTRSMLPNPANHLEVIDFSKNKLSELPDDMFTNMPALTIVNVNGNRLTHLPETVWGAVWSRLDFINVLSMEIKCNDELAWIFKVRPPNILIGDCYDQDKKRNLKELIEEKQRNGK